MSNSYSQIHIHALFAVKHRQYLIEDVWKDKLYAYISGILKNHHHKPIIINGMPDHIHLLFGMRPTHSLSELVQKIKVESTKWINENKYVPGSFSWQNGFGAFSYAKSDLPNIIGYIKNQEDHHRKRSFREEYIELLTRFEIEYDERFLFDSIAQ